MILRKPALIAPILNEAYARPLSDMYLEWLNIDRNYQTPRGNAGLISGLVSRVPEGTDLNPYVNLSNNPGCFEVGQYVPPTFGAIVYRIRHEYTASVPVFKGDCWKIDTDGMIRTLGGTVPNWLNGEFRQTYNYWCFLGTGLRVKLTRQPIGNINTVGGQTHVFRVTSERGVFIRIDEYEPGATGIMTIAFQGGYLVNVVGNRQSDNTAQVLTNGGVSLPPGTHTVMLNIKNGTALADGSTVTDALIRFEYDLTDVY